MDLEKAFDTVNWSLLMTTLKRNDWLERQKNHYGTVHTNTKK